MKNFRLLTLLTFIFFPLLSLAQTNHCDTLWAKSTSGSGFANSEFRGITTDNHGNHYSAGYISGNNTRNFGNGVTVNGSSGSANLLLVKYAANDDTLWAKSTVSATGNSELQGVATDSEGNVYIAGYITGNSSFNIGNGVTVSGNASGTYKNIFVAKYDSSGNALWAKSTTSGPDADSILYGVAADRNGNVYVVGYMDSTSTFGFDDGVTAAGVNNFTNIILIKYDTNGTTQWAKTMIGGTNYSWLFGVALDSYEDIFIGGFAAGTSAFNLGDGVTFTPGGSGSNTLIAKYNSTGNPQWAKTTTSASSGSRVHAIGFDGNNNIFAAGFIGTGTTEFGSGVNVTAAYNGDNALLLKYNNTGDIQWARSPTIAPDTSSFWGVASDYLGNAYATGYISGSGQYNFGNNVTAKGFSPGENIVLINYDSNGNPLLAKSVISGTGSSTLYDVVSNNTVPGDIYAVGQMNSGGPFDLGNNIKVNGTSSSINDVLIVKYRGNYTDPESSSSSFNNSTANSSSSKQPTASSSSSSNPAVVSDASSLKSRLPKLFALTGGAILLIF